jgi:hypothetical protein
MFNDQLLFLHLYGNQTIISSSHTILFNHAPKTKTLNLKNSQNNFLKFRRFFSPRLVLLQRCFISKIQSCEKVELIGNHRRATMVETACENNYERIDSDSDTIENIVAVLAPDPNHEYYPRSEVPLQLSENFCSINSGPVVIF